MATSGIFSKKNERLAFNHTIQTPSPLLQKPHSRDRAGWIALQFPEIFSGTDRASQSKDSGSGDQLVASENDWANSGITLRFP